MITERKELMIPQTDDQISKMSETMFRNIVNKVIDNRALSYLNTLAAGHSKSEKLVKLKLQREAYFEDDRFTKSDVELLLALRTRMVRNVKSNFPTQYQNDIACQVCHVQVDCQQHLLNCTEIRKHVSVPSDMKYEDIHGTSDKQLRIVRTMKQILRKREILLS